MSAHNAALRYPRDAAGCLLECVGLVSADSVSLQPIGAYAEHRIELTWAKPGAFVVHDTLKSLNVQAERDWPTGRHRSFKNTQGLARANPGAASSAYLFSAARKTCSGTLIGCAPRAGFSGGLLRWILLSVRHQT